MPRDTMCDAQDVMALERLDAKLLCPRRHAICHGAEPLVQHQLMRKSVDSGIHGGISEFRLSNPFVLPSRC
jgi:hypothetical protein